MQRAAILALVLAAAIAHDAREASAAPFRPFVDEVGVAPGGVIVATTTASDQSDPPGVHRQTLVVMAPDGAPLLTVRPEVFIEQGVAFDPKVWRALDRWLAGLRLQRVATAPLAELRCTTHAPDPDEVACPSTTGALVRTPTGLARWNPDGASPIWAWGEPRVATVGATCVLLLPDNRGALDRTEAHAVACPP